MEQNSVFLKAHQKTICVRDGKVFDGEVEVNLGNTSVLGDGELATVRAHQLARDFYKKLIARPFENVIIFTGAGTSKSSGGKLMSELWDEEFPQKRRSEDIAFFESINYVIPTNETAGNIEELLSQAQKAASVLQQAECATVVARIRAIKDSIVQKCTLSLSETSPHQTFLNRVTSRKLKYSRVKIFTLNYDTLFEQAAAEGSFLAINGFSFSYPPRFNGSFFDYDIVNRRDSRVNPEESFVPKVFHLYKPHGSINWEKAPDSQVVAKDINVACQDPHIIYPNSDKYEYAYEQPFFEMMSRFQQSIRQSNTLLVCIGFGFGDKHFKNVILESVKSNPGLSLLIALPNFMGKESVTELVGLSEKQNNIVLVDEDFQGLTENYPFSGEYEHNEKEQSQAVRQ